MSYLKSVSNDKRNILFCPRSLTLSLRPAKSGAERKTDMSNTKQQKPNLSVVVSPKATKLFVKPGMQFRPE